MGIYDRGYMRQDDPDDPGKSIKRWLTIAVIAVSLLTLIVWLGRSLGMGRAPHYEKRSLLVNINTAVQELETLAKHRARATPADCRAPSLQIA